MTSLFPQRRFIATCSRWFRILLFCSVLVGFGSFAGLTVLAEESPAGAAEIAGATPAHHEGLTRHAPLIDLGIFKVTNSMIATWIVAIGIIIFAQYAMRNVKEVPDGAQNFWEWLVESLHNLLESIIGRDLTKKTFWFFATVFIFILFTNWAGLIPGVGTIGWGHPEPQGGLFEVTRPLFRGVNADLNMTAAMASVFFVLWTFWAFQANGPGGVILHIFGPKGKPEGLFMQIVMIFVFAAVGILEVISISVRPVSLSFRLFGNIFAGENMLEAMSHIVPGLSWLIPVPFYFMEMLVGVVQALVFMLLTAVFTLLICQHEEEGHH